ncbi:MAG: 23S rRNA (adenine(2503)-C(2))-methyltransferase RlmN [Candidatus Marinimicrobia bacterium]|nr:23S rRNA (adenine(2503)-C(2))-methyltransferase RlmN [Candidatus Neomarinimicrobiota bacterium]
MSKSKNTAQNAYLELKPDERSSLVRTMGESQFRTQQINNWIYEHHVAAWVEMENLPQSLREKLNATLPLHPLEIINITGSETEATRKFLFKTKYGHKIESVLMHDGDRTTVCISSQVGCAVDCKFCATASMGFIKNLSTGEIVDQVIHLQRESKSRITNVVFMGMGEPFLNYRRVIEGAKALNKIMGFGARRITISTAGIVPRVKQFADENHQFKLAISLNAIDEKNRKKIMPLTETHPLYSLMEAARYYYEKTRRFITFEYVLLKGINDSPEAGKCLIDLLRSLPCKVNIIPYNEIGGEFSRPGEQTIHAFLKSLKDAPFTVTVRWSKGTDIDAGCGQLAVKEAA